MCKVLVLLENPTVTLGYSNPDVVISESPEILNENGCVRLSAVTVVQDLVRKHHPIVVVFGMGTDQIRHVFLQFVESMLVDETLGLQEALITGIQRAPRPNVYNVQLYGVRRDGFYLLEQQHGLHPNRFDEIFSKRGLIVANEILQPA